MNRKSGTTKINRIRLMATIFVITFWPPFGQAVSQTVFPGLRNPDGSVHEIHQPNPVTGQTLNILDFGADTANNDHDDLPAIQSALDVAQPGDEIYFPDGVYNLNSKKEGTAHIVPKNTVNLRGQSRGGTILLSAFGDKSIERIFKIQGKSNIVISNFTVTANFTGRYSKDVQINNPEAGGPNYGIAIEDYSGIPSFNITVDSVRCSNFRRMGIRIANSHDVVVRNSYFSDATDVAGGGAGYGVSIQGNSQWDNNAKWNLVEDCDFIGPYIRHGVLIQYASHNNLVQNNYFTDNRLDAIDLHGEDEYLNEIAFNRVENVLTGAGVGVGNTGSTHDASGPNNYIHDNVLVNCREGVKVYLGSPKTRIENNTVTGSTVTNGKGIYILNGPDTYIKGNLIRDNSGYNFTGIYLRYDPGTQGKGSGIPKNVTILENEIYNNAYGIRIFDGEGIVVEDNIVYNNSEGDVLISPGVSLYKLVKIAVVGQGTVEMEPPGGAYPEGTMVTLYAKRAANWGFSHWEGDLTGSENPATILLDQTKSVRAVFEQKPNSDEVNLIVTTVGGGHIEFDPPGGIYNRGDSVKVIAIPDSGWGFVKWGGDFTTESNPLNIVPHSDTYLVAFFEKFPVFQLAIWTIGQGSVLLDPPGGIYYAGTTVTLTAKPEEGWEFDSWGGILSGSLNPVSLTVSGDGAIIANFRQATFVSHGEKLPETTRLFQNFPNPFNPKTEIVYELNQPAHVKMNIYNMNGQLVHVLENSDREAGTYRLLWRGVDSFGRRLASGIYLLEMRANNYYKVTKMTMVE